MTIEKIGVNEIINKLKKGELENPGILADYLVILSASLYTAGTFELDMEINYSKKWEEIKLSGEMTDKLTDAKAKQIVEYRDWKKAQIANKTILNCIQSLKKKLTNMNEEFKSGQNY